jgi:hypothetical protein
MSDLCLCSKGVNHLVFVSVFSLAYPILEKSARHRLPRRHTMQIIDTNLYALTSIDGTAMAETALCGKDLKDPVAQEQARSWAGTDHDGGYFTDCTNNEEIVCQQCGYGQHED